MKFLNAIDLAGNSIDNGKTPTLDGQGATKLYVDSKPAGGTLIINAARPPTDTDGAVGDYWLDTAGKTLYGPKGTGGYGASQSTVAVGPNTSQPVNAVTVGARLKVLTPGRFTGLRYYRYGGQVAHTITLIVYLESTHAEIARTVVNNAANASAGWAVADLSTPLLVTANTDYRVGYSNSVPVTVAYATGLPTSAIPAMVTIVGGCYVQALNSYPSTNDSSIFYMADIVFQPTLAAWPIAIKSAP